MTSPRPDSTGVTLIPGDAWGPPATSAAVAILEALGASIAWDIVPAGRMMAERTGEPLPKRLFSSARKSGVCLKGPLDLRDPTRPEATLSAVESAFREELGVHSIVHWIPLPEQPAPIFVRDWSEHAGATREWSVVSGVVEQLRAATSKSARRLVRLAIDVARANHRGRVVFALAPDRPALNDLYRQEIARGLRDRPPVDFSAATEEHLLGRLSAGESLGGAVILQPTGASDLLVQIAASRAGGAHEVPAMAVGKSVTLFEVSAFSVPTGDEPEAHALVGMIRAAERLLHHLGRRAEGERLAATIARLQADETIAHAQPRDFARAVSTLLDRATAPETAAGNRPRGNASE